jgi:hypothetical protein
MQIDPWTILFTVGMGSLLIERIFYYRSKYKNKKNDKPDNPGHGERIAILEKGQEELEKSNEKDHNLIRADIKKLFNLFNGIRK